MQKLLTRTLHVWNELVRKQLQTDYHLLGIRIIVKKGFGKERSRSQRHERRNESQSPDAGELGTSQSIYATGGMADDRYGSAVQYLFIEFLNQACPVR